MTGNLKKILFDDLRYSRFCCECAEKGKEITQEDKKKFLSKSEREKILKAMTPAEIDYLIKKSSTVQAKNYYAKFKNKKFDNKINNEK